MAGDRLPRPLPASEAPRAIARLLGPAAVDARITFRFVFTLLRFSKASVSVFQFRVACCRHDYYSFADGLPHVLFLLNTLQWLQPFTFQCTNRTLSPVSCRLLCFHLAFTPVQTGRERRPNHVAPGLCPPVPAGLSRYRCGERWRTTKSTDDAMQQLPGSETSGARQGCDSSTSGRGRAVEATEPTRP